MFTADAIQARLWERPFGPLRIVTSTGQTYDIYHPDLVLVARRFLVIGLSSAENPSQADQVTRVSLLHVTDLQDLPTRNATTDHNSALTSGGSTFLSPQAASLSRFVIGLFEIDRHHTGVAESER